ncbi:MAG: hypothetical protein LBQ52_06425 [Helicobacteraceae bacterium]|jgi:hypothetical protein|nr:hypothetical protein [Helicobacteraceae bacterium]
MRESADSRSFVGLEILTATPYLDSRLPSRSARSAVERRSARRGRLTAGDSLSLCRGNDVGRRFKAQSKVSLMRWAFGLDSRLRGNDEKERIGAPIRVTIIYSCQ